MSASSDHQAHPASLLGEVVARTYRLMTLLEVQEHGVLYRAAHVVRPEPFCVLLLDDDVSDEIAEQLNRRALALVADRHTKAPGGRVDFVQQGRCERLGRRLLAWPAPVSAPEPIDEVSMERRLTGQLPALWDLPDTVL
jgi:hypothetical protein